jgi:hypothetical protein
MKRLLALMACFALSAAAANYPDTTTSVVLKYTGSTINLGRFGSVASGDEIECKKEEEWKPLIGDSRFAVMKINGVSPTKWGSGSPSSAVQGWPGWLYWDATGDTLYAKDTGEGTTTGWVVVSGAGGTNSFSVNGSVVSSPNLTNSATSLAAVSGSNITLNPTNIANAQIAVGAAIARSKMAAGTANHVLINDGSGNESSEATLGATRFPALTGDLTTPGGSLATTLATVNGNVGSFGDGTHVAAVTVNGKGLITAVSSVAITGGTSDNWSAVGTTNSSLVGNATLNAIVATNGITAGSSGTGSVSIGAAGVVLTDDGDGSLIITGNGNGNDEALKFDFDNTANTVVVSSSTGVTTINTGSIGIVSTANSAFTAPTLNNPTTVNPTITFPAINYAYLTTNNTSFGFYMTGVTNSSGGTINQWEAVYVKSDGSIDKADANGSGTYPSWGLATGSITTGTTGTIITMGNVRNDSWTFTPGATVWVSTTAGALTTTQPATTGDKIQAIGKALTATQLLLRPSQDFGTAP